MARIVLGVNGNESALQKLIIYPTLGLLPKHVYPVTSHVIV